MVARTIKSWQVFVLSPFFNFRFLSRCPPKTLTKKPSQSLRSNDKGGCCRVSSGALCSASEDGKFLMCQLLVEGGIVGGMSTGHIPDKPTKYGDNNAMTLASALCNACNPPTRIVTARGMGKLLSLLSSSAGFFYLF
jgi:hypothetical protein